jgi:acyl carrier protein
MTQQEIEQKVIELAADQAGVPATQVTRVTHFFNDLNYDSLDVVEFAMSAEDEFEISIADEDVDKIKTVEEAVDYVMEKTKAVAAS